METSDVSSPVKKQKSCREPGSGREQGSSPDTEQELDYVIVPNMGDSSRNKNTG